MRSLIAASIATAMLAPLGVQAADLPPPVTGPAVYPLPAAYRAVANWSGFYVGGNIGVGLARDKSTFSAGGVTFATADTAVFGAVAGGQAGYNWQFGALVLGAEGDFDWSNLKGSISAQCTPCAPAAIASLEHDVDWFGTARGRIGYAADGWLVYATGGYAFGRVALKGSATGGGVNASLTQNATPSGWTIGAGTELALGPNWSARLEYLYVDLGTVNNTIVVTGAPSLTDSARIQMNVVRAGVNYRF
ncbi:MAG: porin family protein [Rhizobiales bacterium]|nr:porin family protein [Hyphomicrobiales bacterium]